MEHITIKPDEKLIFDTNKFLHKISFLKSSKYKASDLIKISILTSDQGPALDDVALALFFGSSIVFVPSEHKSYRNLYVKISKNFKVDYQKVIDAMSCTDNAEFILWSKSSI